MGMRAEVTCSGDLQEFVKRDKEAPSAYKIAHDELECDHKPDGVVRLAAMVVGNGTTHYKSQCTRCGRVVRAHKKADLTAEQMASAVPWDDDISRRYYSRIGERTQELQEARQREWNRRYGNYLESSRWHQIRQAVLRRDKWTCQGCLSAKATEVHHLTYQRVGAEMLFDLVAICGECHRRLHAGL